MGLDFRILFVYNEYKVKRIKYKVRYQRRERRIQRSWKTNCLSYFDIKMRIISFEDSISWQKAREISGLVYSSFSNVRDYDYKSQIQRAAVSVMNNIAEGFERGSNRDFIKFLYIAKGSCGEVRSMLYLARDFNYLDTVRIDNIDCLCSETSRILSGLIKSLKS